MIIIAIIAIKTLEIIYFLSKTLKLFNVEPGFYVCRSSHAMQFIFLGLNVFYSC